MNGKKVYILRASWKDSEPENVGVFDSPRAMVAGLAAAVFDDHSSDKDKRAVAKAVALAVYDLVSISDFESETDECRDGNTVYGWEAEEVQSLGKEKEDA